MGLAAMLDVDPKHAPPPPQSPSPMFTHPTQPAVEETDAEFAADVAIIVTQSVHPREPRMPSQGGLTMDLDDEGRMEKLKRRSSSAASSMGVSSFTKELPSSLDNESDEEYVATVKRETYRKYKREHRKKVDIAKAKTISVGGQTLAVSDEVARQRIRKARALANRDHFACQGAKKRKAVGNNKIISEKLSALADMYGASGEQWREYTTRNAARQIAKLPYEIKSGEDARQLHKVGDRMARKIQEIIDTGSLQKLEHYQNDERVIATDVFKSIWGVGAATASDWVYKRGWRTLDDVRAHPEVLTTNQTIGLRFYDDIKTRIPRSEVKTIEDRVRSVVLSIIPGATLIVCGSYRRGKLTCGDIDILLTHPDDNVAATLIARIVPPLRESGLLTYNLTKEDSGDKYMGLCCLGPGQRQRRIDLKSFPQAEFGCALLYFTGSDYWNRSLRTFARRRGYSLSEHALVRRFSRDTKSEVPVPGLYSESDVMRVLGLKYVPPGERDV